MRSSGAPVSGAAGFPPRCARRRPLNASVGRPDAMATDDNTDPERPHRIATRAREIADFLAQRQRHYAERAQDFGYSREVFETVVSSFTNVSDNPIFSATEASLSKFDEFLRVREAKTDALSFDVSSASYALGSTSTSTASLTASVELGTWIQKVRPPDPPPHWTKDRIEQYARKLGALNAELGNLARSVWQSFYGGSDSAERTSVFLMRQLYDHMFSLLASDEEVRNSAFFKHKKGNKPQQVHRRERLQYAAFTRVPDRLLGEALFREADQVLDLYEQLNRLHTRGALDPVATRNVLTSMQAVIEQWVDALGL